MGGGKRKKKPCLSLLCIFSLKQQNKIEKEGVFTEVTGNKGGVEVYPHHNISRNVKVRRESFLQGK